MFSVTNGSGPAAAVQVNLTPSSARLTVQCLVLPSVEIVVLSQVSNILSGPEGVGFGVAVAVGRDVGVAVGFGVAVAGTGVTLAVGVGGTAVPVGGSGVPLAGTSSVGSSVAGSSVAGSAVAGSSVAGSSVAGSPVAGSSVAGSSVAGMSVAGSAVAGSPELITTGSLVATGFSLTPQPYPASNVVASINTATIRAITFLVLLITLFPFLADPPAASGAAVLRWVDYTTIKGKGQMANDKGQWVKV